MESMKSLILLDCAVLLGSDLQWMGAANVGDGGFASNPPVLATANVEDDAPDSPGQGAAGLGQQPSPTYGAKGMEARASDAD